LSGRGLCDELITRPEESYRPCCVVVCDLETSRMGAPYIYDISRLRVKQEKPYVENTSVRPSVLLSQSISDITLFYIFAKYGKGNGPVSPVGIATDYGLDGPGIESR